MKIILLHIICLITISSTYSQNKFEISDAETFYLNINNESYDGPERISFKEFIIKDFRFDSTKFGYIKRTKISLKKNNSEGLSEFLNTYYKKSLDPNSDKSLVVILKKFWVQRDATDIVSEDKIRPDFGFGSGDNTGACITDIDVFCQSENKLYPLLKITDNFFYSPYNQSQMADFVLLPFDSLVKKSMTINATSIIANRQSYTWNEINTNYSGRYTLPILSATSTSKGVFTSFESFKKNETRYPDFIVKKSKLTEELYIVIDGKEDLLLDLWGFYDGKDYFIKCGFNFYKLFRQNNSWDIYGSKFITEKHNQYSYKGITLSAVNPAKVKIPLQLDMETGKLY